MSELNEKLQEIKRQKDTYILPENLKKDVTAFGITGTLEKDIMLYANKETMLQDVSEPEHEYGVVYGDKTEPIHEGSTIRYVTLNKEVTLDEAITSSKYWYMYKGMEFDVNFSISSNYANFSVRIQMDSIIEARYTSNDGINYVLEGNDYQFDIGRDIELYNSEQTWLPELEKFVLSGGKFFEGMYEWVNEIDEEYWDTITNLSVVDNVLTSTNEQQYLPTLWPLVKRIHDKYGDHQLWFIIVKENNKYYMYSVTNFQSAFAMITNANNPLSNMYVGYTGWAANYVPENPTCERYELDLENDTYKLEYIPLDFIYETTGSWATKYYGHMVNAQGIICWGLDTTLRDDYNFVALSGVNIGSSKNITMGHISLLTWHHVKTEYTLEHPNQLLPGINAMGKHGDIVGDGSIYENIDIRTLLPNYSLINETFLTSNNLDISSKTFIRNNINDVDKYLINEGITERIYIADMSIENYSPVLLRYFNGYSVILCNDDKLRIYNENKELIKTITLTETFDYSFSGLAMNITITNNKLAFIIYNKSYSEHIQEGTLCMGYLDLSNMQEQVYYNTGITTYAGYSDRDGDSLYAHLYCDNTSVYTLLQDTRDGSKKIYKNAECVYSLPSSPSAQLPYTCGKDGIYIAKNGESGDIREYWYYSYNDNTHYTYTLPKPTFNCCGTFGTDDNNVYVACHSINSNNKCLLINKIENGNNVTTLFEDYTRSWSSTYYKYAMFIIGEHKHIIIYPYYGTVLVCDSSDNSIIDKSLNYMYVDDKEYEYQNRYEDRLCLNTTRIIDKLCFVVKQRPEIEILNTHKDLVDISITQPQNQKLYLSTLKH